MAHGAAAQKPLRVTRSCLDQIIQRGVACSPDSRSDPAAAGRNLAVGCPGRTLFELVGPDAGKDGVGVSIDKPGHHHAISGVNDFAIAGDQTLDLSTPAHGFDAMPTDQQRAVFNDGKLA